ncbi:MAG: diacylglycerol kinase [Sulfuricurvum sp.]|jgi:diacylglycerol kinase (ATP)|uniref:diacylglycerol kinase n=1 Tax=Sulfuricurvum sp. TaxID=2025608 RepID=UPI0025DA0210|nr:diacylglycerol kinase [Sulfuricurvum sp.]MCI4406325.1 diacylglycerol kinase [Sulfuricurvum sp.]
MALNKPKYTLFKNTRYALEGLREVSQNEKSFRLQIVLFVVGMILAWVLPISFVQSSILSVSMFIPIMAEMINSSVERTVDLVTFDHHELAKRAKDAGAALVFLSLSMLALIWGLVLYNALCM